jgi:6,7-dimethyl-8-ribityllumazine synthase
MSGHGAPSLALQAPTATVAIVASSWHDEIMEGLIEGANEALAEAQVASVELIRAAGSFELPIIAAAAARSFDIVVALGVIIRGGTPHFEYVSSAATDGLARVALDTAVPVGFGLLTTDNEAQALDRAGLAGSTENKGREAAEAAIATWVTLQRLNG